MLTTILAALLVASAAAAGPARDVVAEAGDPASTPAPGITADLSPQRAREVSRAFDRLARQPEEGTILGRIEIPRVGVSAVIREGVDDLTIRRGVGHFPSTPPACQGGNTALAAHRTTDFRGLKDIRIGDEVTVTTRNGTFRYRVEETWVVAPEEVWVLDPTDSPVLTLVTCYPFDYRGQAPKRFVVRAAADPALPGCGHDPCSAAVTAQ